jgi:hypothetical protein
LKELPMPDLDQIKQGEQERGTGASGSPSAGCATRGRGAGSRNKPNLVAAALLEGESEALTRRAV